MKIRIISDLHLEGCRHTYIPHGEDLLILAGDISSKTDLYLKFIEKVKVPFIATPGNHEFYGHEFNSRLKELKTLGYKYNEIVELGGISFICGTGWSDFELEPGKSMFAKINAGLGINDFRKIKFAYKNQYRKWSPNDHQLEAKRYKLFMESALRVTEGKPRVVVSHFLPLAQCIHSDYAYSSLNSYFASDYSKYVKQVPLWIHGHTHKSLNFKYGDTRIICNPKGYGTENATEFDNLFIMEI